MDQDAAHQPCVDCGSHQHRRWVALRTVDNDGVSHHCRLRLKVERDCDRKWQRDGWSKRGWSTGEEYTTTSTAAASTRVGLGDDCAQNVAAEWSGLAGANRPVTSGQRRRSADRMELRGIADLIHLSTLFVALLYLLSGTPSADASSPGRHDAHTWPGNDNTTVISLTIWQPHV